ncbi:hypothetical protein CBL_08424 [Carabus blaptoides fortunei]
MAAKKAARSILPAAAHQFSVYRYYLVILTYEPRKVDLPQPSCSMMLQNTEPSVTPDHDDLKAALDEFLSWMDEPVMPADIGRRLVGILTDTKLEDEVFEPTTPPFEKSQHLPCVQRVREEEERDDSPLAQREWWVSQDDGTAERAFCRDNEIFNTGPLSNIELLTGVAAISSCLYTVAKLTAGVVF